MLQCGVHCGKTICISRVSRLTLLLIILPPSLLVLFPHVSASGLPSLNASRWLAQASELASPTGSRDTIFSQVSGSPYKVHSKEEAGRRGSSQECVNILTPFMCFEENF